jgi:hypothetical protein
MPSVARLAARTGPVRAVTGTADPRYVPAANAPARQSVGAEPHAHAPPPRCGQDIDQPPVVQTGAVDANQRGTSPSTSVLNGALRRSVPAKAAPSLAHSAAAAHQPAMMTAGSAPTSAVRPRGPLMRIRLPEPMEARRMRSTLLARGLQVRLGSNVVSFAWVRGRPPRPIRYGQPRSRTVPDPGERRPALLESVLGATPREFESRILRHADLRRRARITFARCAISHSVCLIFCLSLSSGHMPYSGQIGVVAR